MMIISVCNKSLFALTFTAVSTVWVITVIITLINGIVEYEVPLGITMVASVTVTVLFFIITLFFQGSIMSGLTAGSIKG
tara:strand:- start:212 stop:448 length:237 start_codon:yes stop_codon:yes gene_type:complete